MTSDTELSSLATIEGSTSNRPPKPIIEMSDEELTTWVQSMRNCLTQYQSLMAEARAGSKEKQQPDASTLNMFE